MFSNIVLASDGSDFALRAAKQASELAVRFRSRLTMVHVFEVPTVPAVGNALAGWVMMPFEPPSNEARQAVVNYTRSAISPDLEVNDVQELGPPAPTILRIAEDEKADLIVMGSRGMGAVGRLFLGSVSDNVTHHAHCSVMIVK